MKIYRILFAAVIILGFSLPMAFGSNEPSTKLEAADSIKITKLIERHLAKKTISSSKLMLQIANSLVGTPYVGHTLETEGEEHLVVNLREFDCTTFIETVLALTMTVQSDAPGVETFCQILQALRYRKGRIDGYGSRLHYFSEWIADNEKKGFVENITNQFEGEPLKISVNYMSTHPEAYLQLKDDSLMRLKIATVENKLSDLSKTYYLPKEKVSLKEPQLPEGTIVGITTNIEGLDFIHTGILIRVGQQIHLLHASSDNKKVLISEQPLSEYLMSNKRQTGIVILSIDRAY